MRGCKPCTGEYMRVLIADDHTMVRESLISLLQADGELQVVAQAADGIEALEQAVLTRPDIVITDLSMPRLNGIELVRRLREALPDTRVLVLTMHQEDEYVLQAVRAGASGYLVKDSAGAELLPRCTACMPAADTSARRRRRRWPSNCTTRNAPLPIPTVR